MSVRPCWQCWPLISATLCLIHVGSSQWKIPSDARLLTRWANQVTPTNVLPEYPRPQMVRTNWMNLNGLWQYSLAGNGAQPPFKKELSGTILVPFPIESALSGVMKPAERIWYRRTFVLPEDWSSHRILLHFGAVDWEATVYVNGKLAGTHKGGYDPFSFDITDDMVKSGEQELIVGVYDPTDSGDQPRGKQVKKPEGIWYTSSTGIWQTVWLEPVPTQYISDFAATPDLDRNCVNLAVRVSSPEPGVEIAASAYDGLQEVGTVTGRPDSRLQLELNTIKLWSPSEPFLYGLRIRLVRTGVVVDSISGYFGMRKIEVAKDQKGFNRIMLNGKFVMEVGPLDQGFWPDGIYTAPTDAALKYDIEMEKKLGFNMVRKHVKVEPERWYYWTDKLGLLVWQDMPSAENKTEDGRKGFETELGRLVETHRNHPSVIMWVVFNEGWGQYDTQRLTTMVEQMDPSRLVNNASGWTDMKVGDVGDIHSYPKPKVPPGDSKRAAVLGEFGGLGLAIPNHTWEKQHWGYKGMKDREQLASQYESFLRTVYQLEADSGLCAAVYTQITDVETECNGLMTYDREVVKPDINRIAEVNRGDFSHVAPPPIVVAVVPSSEKEGQVWRYTCVRPDTGWFSFRFDDSHWKEGPGGFGTKETPGAIVRTDWKSDDIWIRRTFCLERTPSDSLVLRLHHDDDAEVYLNGVLALAVPEWTTEYEEFEISNEARVALKVGQNCIAVHCHQRSGGQYIDVGLVRIIQETQ